jgi:hypothetical protein
VSCVRWHQETEGRSWPLDLRAVRAELQQERLTRSRRHHGSRPAS